MNLTIFPRGLRNSREMQTGQRLLLVFRQPNVHRTGASLRWGQALPRQFRREPALRKQELVPFAKLLSRLYFAADRSEMRLPRRFRHKRRKSMQGRQRVRNLR